MKCGHLILSYLKLHRADRAVQDMTTTFSKASMIRYRYCKFILLLLKQHLTYEEIVEVCSKLKSGVSSIIIDYEHIRFVEPSMQRLLFILHENFFDSHNVLISLKSGLILPLFKGKDAKASNKDYRGVTLFPTIYKIYEMVLLNRLETHALKNSAAS